MATTTLGTAATTSIAKALTFKPGYNSGMAAADIATIAQAILNDLNVAHPVYPQAFSSNGLLYVPNRGVLTMQAGDVVGVDDRGWPILLSADTIANGSDWVFSP